MLVASVVAACGDRPNVAITNGPYLLDVSATEATVLWTTSEPADGRIESFTTEAGPAARHDHKTIVHELRLSGLRPATLVHYRVRSGRAQSRVCAFTTAPAKPATFRFAIYGGTAGHPEQHAKVADAILAHDPAFVVHTGGYALAGDDAAAWHAEFFAPAGALLSSRPLVPAPGPREKGSRCFSRLFPTATGARWRRYRLFHVELFVVDLTQRIAVGGEQHGWLRNALRRSTAPWKFVVLGAPLLAPGQDTRRRILLPLLLDGGVDAVFTGGQVYERTKPIGSGPEPERNALVSLTTVAAGACSRAQSEPWTARVLSTDHFLVVDVGVEKVTLAAHSLDGRELDSVTLRKRRRERLHRSAVSAEALEVLFAFAPPKGFALAAATKKTFATTVSNPYATPIQGELKWDLTESEGWTIEPPALTIDVPTRGEQTLSFTAAVEPGKKRLGPTFSFVAGERELRARRTPFRAGPSE